VVGGTIHETAVAILLEAVDPIMGYPSEDAATL
jgi:hypothetical protein